MLDVFTLELKTIDDVKSFFTQLNEHGLMFHPEDSPRTVINAQTRMNTFTHEECEHIERRIVEVYDICEAAQVDPCGLAGEILGIGGEE